MAGVKEMRLNKQSVRVSKLRGDKSIFEREDLYKDPREEQDWEPKWPSLRTI